MVKYKILIDGVDYTSSCALPFKEQYVLDSALDNGVLNLFMIPRKEVFKPFTPITITKDSDTYTMFVASDKVTEIVGTGKYNHDLVLIEETKLLEKKVVDTNTTTQPLIHDYEAVNGSVHVTSVYSTQSTAKTNYYNNDMVKAIMPLNTSSLPSARTILTQDTANLSNFNYFAGFSNCRVMVTLKDNNGTTIASISKFDNKALDTLLDLTQLQDGNYLTNQLYSIEYRVADPNILSNYLSNTFEFWGFSQEQIRPKKSITDVVNRLLAITETLRASETPALVFNQEQAQFYDQRDSDGEPLYPAPEFAMTKSTLRECLDQVGSYIHSIVRLVGNTIYFDKLGGTTETTLDADYIGHYETLDAEQYNSQLDSIVSNITNIDDETTGTMTEPFFGAYKTVRAESGQITINDTSAIIETDYPIEKIAKLECGYITVGGKDYLVGDITPYVYEKSEYDLLSSNTGTYPLSKGYAITYTQGQANITGLTFKLPSSVSPIFSKQAILNIISQKLGINVQGLNVQDITELQFRLIYYPSTTARVKQSRTDINDYSMELTSIYNQGANKVDSRAYGENLKGAIARLGNIEKFITYDLSSPDDLPNVGDYVIINNEDYYIATLSVENQIDHTKATIGLSKDFNALSKYIGIKNNIRLYEVSEKQSVERYIVYDDYCVIGTPIISDNKQLISTNGIINTLYQFTLESSGKSNVTVARLEATDVDGNKIKVSGNRTKIDLPVFSLGLGNTLWFGFKYKDNYSAGNQSINPPQGDTLYRLNQYVSYGDYFGEIETIGFKLFRSMQNTNNKTDAINIGNALPVATMAETSDYLFTTGNDDIVVKKDSREQINMSYQMHFVTNDKIIIGTQMAQGNPSVSTNNMTHAKLYVLPNRINKFASDIDLTGATLVKDYENATSPDIEYTSNSIIFGEQTATASGKSWAMIDSSSGKLLFGKNIEIKNGQVIEMPTMTFTHKVI